VAKPRAPRRSARRRSHRQRCQQAAEQRVLPMQLQVGDRLTDETGEYEVIGRPYTTNAGKDVHVRVKRVDQSEVTEIRSWGAHERLAVRRR
jgi:hypothetical protein